MRGDLDRPMSTKLGDAGVSRREREVFDAVGEHLTNAQIAVRLHVSVRTVEGHVSTLLRKLGVRDRWALADIADEIAGSRPSAASWPSPLTSFVGRAAERAALAEALAGARLVTALGPGGVGKTRLAIAVAAAVAERYAGGVWYVDLVPVTQAAMIAQATADVLRLEAPGRAPADAVVAALSAREALVVLDNCEHLVDPVAAFVEDLLARCDRVSVLTTSRIRMRVPFERVFPVPGLSLPGDAAPGGERAAGGGATGCGGGGPGDAIALFEARAEAAGRPTAGAEDIVRLGALCRALDGNALAIELAAARLPTLGLDGLEAGLVDRLRLLAGGARRHDRHRSLRATLDLSYDLASPVDQAILRRLAVLVAAFGVEAATAVAGFAPVPPGDEAGVVADAIGRLAEQSLVVPRLRAGLTSYRLLEILRQYGAERLRDAGEEDQVRERHLQLCRQTATALLASPADDSWRDTFDDAADDLRAALAWVAEQPGRQDKARDLAMLLATLAFRRGLLAEAQSRFEQAATFGDGADAVAALSRAAGVAVAREAGDDAFRLYREAARAAARLGRGRGHGEGDSDGWTGGPARQMAQAATLVNRMSGIMTNLPSPAEVDGLLTEARILADTDTDPGAKVAVLVAEAFARSRSQPEDDSLAREAVARARELGDPLLASAALDALTLVQEATGQLEAAATSSRARTELLAPLALDAETAAEVHDAHHMTVLTHLAVGDLASADRFAEALRRTVFQEGRLDALRLVVTDALAGRWTPVLVAAAEFRAGWERQGRPQVPVLITGAHAVAMVHGVRGDDEARASWLALGSDLDPAPDHFSTSRHLTSAVFDALVLLHHGHFDRAMERMTIDPGVSLPWLGNVWLSWYAALWAEAAVLAGHPDAGTRVHRARDIVAPNRVAAALVARAHAWAHDDRQTLEVVAKDLEAAGCRYQMARTLAFTEGEERSRGEDLMAELGAAPMASP